MAITIYGTETAPLVLQHDAGKPKPRTLRVRFLTMREVRAWQKKVASAREVVDVDARDTAYIASLGEAVTGWENVDGEFSAGAIMDRFTLPEVMAILDSIPMAMVPGADDAKKSV